MDVFFLVWVLIVPLWNWNNLWSNKQGGSCLVLIVPLWNWNLRDVYFVMRSASSNRTFMELKSLRYIRTWAGVAVLIVPLWNWNNFVRLIIMHLILRSNRTFMELKSDQVKLYGDKVQVLIVPLWNWNLSSALSRLTSRCSNRTFMELK